MQLFTWHCYFLYTKQFFINFLTVLFAPSTWPSDTYSAVFINRKPTSVQPQHTKGAPASHILKLTAGSAIAALLEAALKMPLQLAITTTFVLSQSGGFNELLQHTSLMDLEPPEAAAGIYCSRIAAVVEFHKTYRLLSSNIYCRPTYI